MKLKLIIASLLFFQIAMAQEVKKDSLPEIWSLQNCISYAVKNNISIKDASLDKDIAEIDFTEAKSSRLPNLYFSASQNFSNGNTVDPITSEYVTDQIHSTNAGLYSSVTIFQGKTISNEIAQNKLLVAQSEFLEKETKNNIILSILENYLQTLYSKEDILIAENNLATSEKEVLRAKALLDAGNLTLSDYAETQSQAATNKYNLIAAKNTYQQYIIELRQLLELDPTINLEIEELDKNAELFNIELNKLEIYNKALKFLPEVEAGNLNIAVYEKELEIAKGDYLPTLSLTTSIGTGYTSYDDDNFTNQLDYNFNQNVGLSLTVPIFNRNSTKAAVKTADLNIKKAQIDKQTTVKEVYKKVETAYQNALSSQEQLVAAKSSQDAAQQSYKLAQRKYELGELSTTDLILSQNTYSGAQQNYLQAKYLTILYHQLLQFYQGNNIKI